MTEAAATPENAEIPLVPHNASAPSHAERMARYQEIHATLLKAEKREIQLTLPELQALIAEAGKLLHSFQSTQATGPRKTVAAGEKKAPGSRKAKEPKALPANIDTTSHSELD